MANGELPQQLQDQLGQLQNLQQQLQVTSQQRAQLEFQVKESERALEELVTVDEKAPIYRSVGSLLVRTGGKTEVEKRLKDEKETLEVRLAQYTKQESRLKEKATELQTKLQAALKNLPPPSSSQGTPKKAPK
jgi:prefoldin beta subunit